ncbi:hypothetical protein [Vibrio harveyi]|uniref:hypothetical protein n=1 Tax=Vibrio harveyi TaxID=669 RepID=UPI00093837F9|nr:hypothetical protein [Vibrio harveyi]APP05806.1 hypothetical protein BG259_10900 [Vibrio harveyi]
MDIFDQLGSKASGVLDSAIEGAGELIGGAVDVVGDFGNDWLGIKMGNELERAKSASPDENRANNNSYQQPNGKPVEASGKGMQWQTIAIVVVLLLLVLGGMAFALKGGK